MNYKVSRFSVKLMDKNNHLIMFNTRNAAFVKLKNEFLEEFKNQVQSKQFDMEDERIKYLVNKGFLVEEDFDEERFCENIYIEACHSMKYLSITILPTEGCNFRCEYCYEEHKTGFMSKEVQDRLIHFVNRKMKDYGRLNINWFGGEPLLGLDIIEYLSTQFKAICKKYRKAYSAQMTSNGYLLTLDTYKKLKYLGVRDYQITLDGFAETHDTQRFLANKEGTWDVIINNLRAIRDHDKSALTHFTIRTNVTKKMVPRIEEFRQFLLDEFGNDSRFRFRQRAVWNGANIEGYEEGLVDQTDVNKWTSEAAIDKTKGTKQNLESIRQNIEELVTTFQPCYAGKSNCMVVNPKGEVLKCTANLYDENSVVGNLEENGNIKYNNHYLEWVIKPTDKEVSEKCYKCDIYPLCKGVGCPHKTMHLEKREETCNSMRHNLYNSILVYSSNEEICKVLE